MLTEDGSTALVLGSLCSPTMLSIHLIEILNMTDMHRDTYGSTQVYKIHTH